MDVSRWCDVLADTVESLREIAWENKLKAGEIRIEKYDKEAVEKMYVT